ncbi:SLAC1 anion channel family protein [Neptunomonas antarctica]|uniref:Tellurite resistance protein n=1 Tax=Neptunomonas antarctica TaxID=619304 RepID=A0A1N7JFK2_9GAMM|nr:SLAC1 anion channel family protein [Neptunomonas antarctica]SIS48107.1 tellurite resistance protein [Neptunomonas antarctica]
MTELPSPPKIAIARLQHFPVAFFSMIMGTLGLTLAWQKSANVLALPTIISQVLLIVSATLFAIIVSVYLLKIVRHSSSVIAEFNHPITMSFFPAFSISIILMSIATLEVSTELSRFLWILGSTLQLIFTLNALTRWIHHRHFQITHSTPAWFIPVVGNILIPISGVEHGFYEVSWFFFSIGIIYWIVLKTLIFNRIIFHEPLPERLLPTLFILIAPPAVGFISYMKLNHDVLDSFGRVLYYAAAFLVLLLMTQFSRFSRIQFYISWWAYSFPLAAFTITSEIMYSRTGAPLFLTLSYLMLGIVSLVVTLLLYKTVKGIISGSLFQAD